ncbi:hypothetical protein CA13_55000 [Planctomycetes bacterium CA13]|uniref:Uncharacterized protein n=1 Tax=Novipirellula herctigrandis TaxID=2527986 RepID=A0A5C5ZA89_9BACT|nr:hypothetical protein CA13_55000 [Planctomycetes bacterium CA13]
MFVSFNSPVGKEIVFLYMFSTLFVASVDERAEVYLSGWHACNAQSSLNEQKRRFSQFLANSDVRPPSLSDPVNRNNPKKLPRFADETNPTCGGERPRGPSMHRTVAKESQAQNHSRKWFWSRGFEPAFLD